MESVIALGGSLVHALFSPVNCVGNLGVDVLHALGNFAGCVGGNLSGSAVEIINNSADVVSTATTAVSSVVA